MIGLRSGNSEWVKQFILDKTRDLAEKEQQNAFTYNMAYYQFSTGDYRGAMKLLQQVEFTDLYYQLDMRSVLLKCYFETGDEDALGYHLSAFRIFLLRHKEVSEYQRIIYKNLIKFTGMLSRYAYNRKKLEELQQQIEDKKQVADINWIRKKVSEAIAAA